MQVKLSSTDVLHRVRSVKEVATLPASLARVLKVTQDPNSTALDLAEEIAKDPALTVKVLGTVNSSFYGFCRRIQTVADAAILLGFTEVERLALAISVINLFGGERTLARALGHLWRHSMTASVAADLIAKNHQGSPSELAGAQTAALLHDIGKALIWQTIPESVNDIRHLMEHGGLTEHEAEHEVLDGVTHCEVGAWLAEAWSLPERVMLSILYHHAPQDAPGSEVLPHITYLANQVCHELDITAMPIADSQSSQRGEGLRMIQLDEALVARINTRIDEQLPLIGMLAGIPA
jgi:putative nucleotidyltransferase with HDIG domain